MEYVLALKEEIWNEKCEQILSILLTIVLMTTVVTGAYNNTDIWKNEMTVQNAETVKTTIEENTVVEMPINELKDAVTEVPADKGENSIVETLLFEDVNMVIEAPLEELANTVMEVPTKEITNTVAEIPTEEITNTMLEVPTEEITNTVMEVPAEERATTVAEVLPEEITNTVVEVPTEEIKNTVAEESTEEIKNVIVEAPTEEVKNTVVEVPTEEVKNTVVEAPTEEVINTVVEVPTEEVINTVEEVSTEEDMITESAFMIDDAGMIYGFSPELADLSKGYLELPTKGCTGIRRGTFAGCIEWITEVHIPSNIVNIEDGAMTELCSLEYMAVEAGHPTFVTVDGVLYDIAGTTLLAYPAARVGAYFVPEQVQVISGNAFLNTSLFIIDIRGCGLSANCLLNISESCSIIE